MDKELMNRRGDCLNHHMQGMKKSEWVPLVASKHNCSEEALDRDWTRRKTWIHYFMKIDNSKQLALEILKDYELTLLDAYHIFEEAEDPKTKIQATWLRLKIMKLKQEFLKEINALDYIKVDFRNQGRKHDVEMDPNPYRKVLNPY